MNNPIRSHDTVNKFSENATMPMARNMSAGAFEQKSRTPLRKSMNGHCSEFMEDTDDGPSQMIRIDYKCDGKKAFSVRPVRSQSDDMQRSSPSSVQEEFYSYLGISSKSSSGEGTDADSLPPPSGHSPPLNDFDLSKRRSLRVRVVNKWKQHQAKLLQMSCNGADGGSGAQQRIENGHSQVDINCNTLDERLLLQRRLRIANQQAADLFMNTEEVLDSDEREDEKSSTILERRCYTKDKPPTTPSSSSPSPALSLISKLGCTATPSRTTPQRGHDELFTDFEQEIKKHVNLSPKTVPTENKSSPIKASHYDQHTTSHLKDATEGTPHSNKIKAGNPSCRRLNRKKKSIQFLKRRHRRLRLLTKRRRRHLIMNLTAEMASKQVRPFSIRLEKLQPEFTLLRKEEDHKPHTVLDADGCNPEVPGPILGVHYCDGVTEKVLLVVAENKVMFFQHSPTVALFQKLVGPANGETNNGHSGVNPERVDKNSAWCLIDEVPRLKRDPIVNTMSFDRRIMQRNQQPQQPGADCNSIVYVEMHAQLLHREADGTDFRVGDMSAVYVNMYQLQYAAPSSGSSCYANAKGGNVAVSSSTVADNQRRREISVKSVPLDTVVGTHRDICYTVLPERIDVQPPHGHQQVVMCWNEVQPTKRHVGICRYRFTWDLEQVLQVDEFQTIDSAELTNIQWVAPNYLIGTGEQQISIWDQDTGALLTNIHLRDFQLGATLYARVLNIDIKERHLILVQHMKNYLNVMHINLLDYAYRVIKSREVAYTVNEVQSVIQFEGDRDDGNVFLGIVSRDEGGCGGGGVYNETLHMFDAMSNRLMAMQSHINPQLMSRLFLTNRHLVKMGQSCEAHSITIQSMTEFLLNMI